ncbi:hypothetical protein MA16_Dca004860 [Dendrobium catenatum]|uniref:Uncharacterized protein n=1 Tax=Dendrobium catenatum TaxID=906689 RepID=A0A2I0WGA2_9ASPA|nr:hypothetical protein MA16_Dca004860 [Dendrobium catenatum]
MGGYGRKGDRVIDRYEKEFGARNYHFSAGKVNFIVVDAQTLDGPKHEKETSVSWEFIKSISTANMSRPRVLLTHIPLYRPNDSPCGSYRSSGVINQRVSFVGHDQGIKYLCQFVVTLLLLFVWPTNGFAIFGQLTSFVSSVRRKWANMKEKVDEEDCEYDMIWDSEGSMHLIKKHKTVPAAYSNVGVTGRGNAVLRSSAKKQSTQEHETSISMEMNTDMNSEKTGKTRQNRSMMISTTVDAVVGLCAANIHQIKWLYLSLASIQMSESVKIVSIILLVASLSLRNSVWFRNDSIVEENAWSRENGQSSYDTVASVVNGVSRLNVDENDAPEADSFSREAVATVLECKCGMPLCICKPPMPDPAPSQNSLVSSSHSSQRPKKTSSNQRTVESISRKPSSSSSSSSSSNKPSSFLNMGQASNGNADKPKADYDVNGEGLREAIKNSDPAGVRKLLSEGVDANYCDKQGLTPLHLAALFNRTEIAFILMDHGASVERKNAQGGFPIPFCTTFSFSFNVCVL